MPELVRGIYKSTPEKDRVLRDIISDKASKNVREVLKDANCVREMKECAEFTFDLLLRVHGDGSREIATLRAEVINLVAAAEEGKRAFGVQTSIHTARLASKDREIERRNDTVSAMKQATLSWKECWNVRCENRFGAYLEVNENTDKVTLRCKRCKCRHNCEEAWCAFLADHCTGLWVYGQLLCVHDPGMITLLAILGTKHD